MWYFVSVKIVLPSYSAIVVSEKMSLVDHGDVFICYK